jgi:hypothetical protein
LQENIKLFPEDKIFIFQCIKKFSKNNTIFLNDNYFYKIFGIDTNFLITEYNWEEELYVADLIILQEYIKANEYKISMILPKFFIKYFNVLISFL